MKYKIQYDCFMKTFSKRQLKDIKDYDVVIKLHNKGCTRKQIMEKVNVSIDKLHQWRNTTTKPCPTKVLEKASQRGYFMHIPQKTLEKLAYLVGYNLGDGNISRNLYSKRRKNSLKNFAQIETKAKFELEKIRKYRGVIRLRKKGLSAYKIANQLGLDVYHVKNWTYFGKKPRLYDFNKSLNSS